MALTARLARVSCAAALLNCQFVTVLHAQTIGPAATQPERDLAHDPRMEQWRQIFFWSVVLLLILIVAAGAIIRFSMRFRTLILRDESPPTESGDVWAMHRFPEKFEFEGGDETPGQPPGDED